MATLADELLNDFEDSGSEAEGRDAFVPEDGGVPEDGPPKEQVELDGEMEEEAEEEAEAREKLEADAGEEDAKTKVEKMQLAAVPDIRNVARLMKTLQPILDVS
jgi:U4/U6 small nuclear ribonucleoprotein PRP31